MTLAASSAPGKISSRVRLAGLVLLVLYVLGGIIYSLALPAVVRFPDEQEYLALTSNFLHGPGFSLDGVHLTAGRPPGYPFLLAAVETLGGGIKAVRVLHYLLIAGTILLVCRICGAPQRSGLLLIATGVVILYPVLFYTAGTLYPQTLAEFLFVAAMAQLVESRRGLLIELTAGLTFGALILAVPTFGLTLLVVLAIALMLRLLNWRGALAVFAGASLMVGMWTARNAMVFHRFVPVASNSGANFLLGNSENTTPYGGSGNVDLLHYMNEAHAKGLDEFAADHYFMHCALAWIGQHPGRAAVLYLEKTLNFFNVWNEYAKGTAAEVSPWKQIVMAASYVLLVGLLFWRLTERKRFPLATWEKLFLIVYVLSAFTTAIFLTRIRHRLPFDYLLITVVTLHLSRRLQPWLGREGAAPASK